MLEQYYVRPTTVDRIRSSWIASAIEAYVAWLTVQRYERRSVLRRIPLAVAFGEFAKSHGATEMAHLPDHVESFVQAWVAAHARPKAKACTRKKMAECTRNPIQQLLRWECLNFCVSEPYYARGREYGSDTQKFRHSHASQYSQYARTRDRHSSPRLDVCAKRCGALHAA